MASLGLGAAGASIAASAALGPFGTAIVAGSLGMAGGYLDQNYIFPMIFGSGGPIEGPRLSDIRLQFAAEGTPINIPFGPANRVAGSPIWKSDIIEERVESGGGKGGGGPVTAEYSYFVDIAIMFGRSPTTAGIDGFEKIYANGKVIWEEQTLLDNTSDQISVERVPKYTWGRISGSPPNVVYGPILSHVIQRMESPNGGLDLTQYQKGTDVTISGFTGGAAVNNGTFVVRATKRKGDGRTKLKVSNIDCVDASAGDDVRLEQDPSELASNLASELEFFTGTETQEPSQIIEDREGIASAHRGYIYVVARHFALGDYGNSIPRIEARIRQTTDTTIGASIQTICLHAGLEAGDIDVTGATSPFYGINLSGPQEPIKALEPMMLAYNLKAQEVDGQLVFTQRGSEDPVVVTEDDLSAHLEKSDDSPRNILIEEVSPFTLPSQLSVRYQSSDMELEDGFQRAVLQNASYENTVDVRLPLGMSDDYACSLAHALIYSTAVERKKVSFTLPPSFMRLGESDIIELPQDDETLTVRATKVSVGANKMIEVQSVLEEEQTFDQDCIAESGDVDPDIPYIAPPLDVILFDYAPLRDEDAQTSGYYYGITPEDPNVRYLGAALYKRTGGSGDFNLVENTSSEMTLGFAITTLAAGPVGYWDRVNTVDVEMDRGTLTSSTEEQVLNGANRIVLGGEVIGFVDVEDLTEVDDDFNTYRLSTLIRGMRDTVDAVATHQEGDIMWVIDSNLRFIAVNSGSRGAEFQHKPVPIGGMLADADADSLLFDNGTMKPFRPTLVKGTRVSPSNDLTISWTRQSRAMTDIFVEGGVPLLDGDPETYIIMITNGTGADISVTNATTYVFTAAQQTAYGITPGNPVDVRIAQVSPIYGAGRYAEETL